MEETSIRLSGHQNRRTSGLPEKTYKVEQGEQHLFDMGFRDFRIRLIKKMALIQIQEEQMGGQYECKCR